MTCLCRKDKYKALIKNIVTHHCPGQRSDGLNTVPKAPSMTQRFPDSAQLDSVLSMTAIFWTVLIHLLVIILACFNFNKFKSEVQIIKQVNISWRAKKYL